MELTEKKLREFFPSNHRFIHFCAKKYGYTFYNQEAVDSAHYYSAINLSRYFKKHGREFEDEKSMVSVIMGAIRYGILTAVSDKSRRASRKYKKSVETIYEADLYNVEDQRDSKYDRACISYDNPADGTHMLIEHFKSLADTLEVLVFEEHIIKGLTLKEVSVEHRQTERDLLNAKQRVRTKFKRLIKDEQQDLQDAQGIVNHEEPIRQADKDVQEEHGYRRLLEEQSQERSYSKTMSFLHSKKEIWDEDYDPWLDGR